MTYQAAQIGETQGQEVAIVLFYAQYPSLQFTQSEIEVLNFRGTDGSVFRSLGVKGEPWTLQGRSDLATELDAWDELLRWRDFVDKGEQKLILGGIDFDLQNARVKVVSVKPGFGDFPPVRVEKGVGYAYVDGTRWVCSAEITLAWVDYTAP